jgi:hypothetical protein
MRVIDFSMLTPGAFCSQILADLGATVLKVERPEGGFRCADGRQRATACSGVEENMRTLLARTVSPVRSDTHA